MRNLGSAKNAAVNVLRLTAWRLRRRAGRVPGEHIPKTLLFPYLPSSPVAVDCGAHDGGDTREIANLWSGATVHAFEAAPKVFKKLSQNTSDLPSVHCHQVALAGYDGMAAMHISSGGTDASSSLLTPKEHIIVNPHVLFEEVVSVDCLTLDTWAEREGCPYVDLLWLDMQGGELAMLKAAPHILSTVRVIHLEVSLTDIYQDNPLLPEVQSWLEAQGFRRRFLAICDSTGGNAVFVRRS